MVKAAGAEVLLSRTGYTGEDGYELYCAPSSAPAVWKALEGAGAVPCGLGARDILRLEARLPLYGHELADDINPLEAGLDRFVITQGRAFPGRDVLAETRERGVSRLLFGLEMTEPGVARQGYPVYSQNRLAGQVTSGGKSPARDSFIALALLEKDAAAEGDVVEVEIHGKRRAARVVKTPFYRRNRINGRDFIDN
jgi:aminomethyltransferase